jgi:hypothetical protein
MLEVTDSSDTPSVIVEEGSWDSISSSVEADDPDDIGSVAGSHRSGDEEVTDEPRNQDTLQDRNARHTQAILTCFAKVIADATCLSVLALCPPK